MPSFGWSGWSVIPSVSVMSSCSKDMAASEAEAVSDLGSGLLL